MIIAMVNVYLKDFICALEHATVVHAHIEAQPHEHNHDTDVAHKHVHQEAEHHGKGHEHDKKDNTDDCCKDETAQFFNSLITSLTKVKPVQVSEQLALPVFYLSTAKPQFVLANTIVRLREWGHPPKIPDIRVLIQSFQV